MRQIKARFRLLRHPRTMQSPPQRRLLLVDDDPDVLNALTFAFETEGYEVVALDSGEALIDHPSPEANCIVIDQRLPGIAGLDAIAILRARGVFTPAILITSNPSPIVRARAYTASIAIIEKPLLSDALSKAVEAVA